MAIEIKELKVMIQVKDSHNSLSRNANLDPVVEQRIIEKSVKKSLEVLTRKLNRLSER